MSADRSVSVLEKFFVFFLVYFVWFVVVLLPKRTTNHTKHTKKTRNLPFVRIGRLPHNMNHGMHGTFRIEKRRTHLG